jgi:putative solute:sodium symporter small subunit
MPDPNSQTHLLRSKRLMLITLCLWFCCAIIVPLLVTVLNRFTIPYLDLPLGFFLGAQGALLAFVVMAFWFAGRQDRIDRDHFIGRDGHGGSRR